MAKSRRTIVAKLPTYQKVGWRKKIRANVLEAAESAGVDVDEYDKKEDRFEVVVLLYLSKGKRESIHDVDNRLKDILDALQGRFGNSRSSKCLIKNDNKISRVIIEKRDTPKSLSGDSAGGKLLIRPYKRHHWPLQTTKGNRLVKRKTVA